MAKTLLKLKQLESLTGGRALESNGDGKITASDVTAAELALLDGSQAGVVVNNKAVIYSADGDIAVGDDLLMPTTGKIDFESGKVTLTHSKDGSDNHTLAFGGSGASLSIDFANADMDNVDIDGGAIDGTVIGANAVAHGTFDNLTSNGNTVVGNANTDSVQFNARIADSSSIEPLNSNQVALGDPARSFSALHVDDIGIDGKQISVRDGGANADITIAPKGTGSVVMAKVDINGGAIDGAVIGGASAQAGTFTSLNVSDGNITNVGSIALDNVIADGTEIDITLTDNQQNALEIKEGGNTYMRFDTRDSGGERIDILKPQDFSSQASTNVNIDSGAIDGAVIGANSQAAISGTVVRAHTSLQVGAVTVTDIADEDNMSSNSATKLATQQSIKAYVDANSAGLDVKESVVAAYDASFTMASTASSSTLVLADGEGGFDASNNRITVDGQQLTHAANVGDRILVKDGVNSNSAGVHNKWNGVYTIGALDQATCTLTRATDFDAASEFVGAPFFFVERGTTNGFHGFVSSVSANPTIGTDAITFFQFTAPSQAQAGLGIKRNANAFDLDLQELSQVQIASGDFLAFHDVTDNSTKKESINDIATLFAGSGLNATNAVLDLHLAELSQVQIAAGDFIPLHDVTDNSTKKESIDDIATFMAGDALQASNGVLAVKLEDTNPGVKIAADKLDVKIKANSGILKDGDGLSVKIDSNSFQFHADGTLQVKPGLAGSGLGHSSGVLSVDIDELSPLGGTGLHQTQDHFIFSDDGTEKKITFSNLEDAIFGNVSGDISIAAGGAASLAANSVTTNQIAASAYTAAMSGIGGGNEFTDNIAHATADDADMLRDFASPLTMVFYNGLRLKQANNANDAQHATNNGDYYPVRVDGSNVKLAVSSENFASGDVLEIIIVADPS